MPCRASIGTYIHEKEEYNSNEVNGIAPFPEREFSAWENVSAATHQHHYR